VENIWHTEEDNIRGVLEARKDIIEEQKRWEEHKYSDRKETIRKEIRRSITSMNEIMKRPFNRLPEHYYFPGINQYM
jgi:hypothetical protein